MKMLRVLDKTGAFWEQNNVHCGTQERVERQRGWVVERENRGGTSCTDRPCDGSSSPLFKQGEKVQLWGLNGSAWHPTKATRPTVISCLLSFFAFSLELEALIFVLFFSSPQLVFISHTLLDPVLTQSRYNVLDMIIVHDWRADLKGKMIVRLSD